MANPLSFLTRRLGYRRPLLGLDIGTDSIKAAEITTKGGQLRVVRSAVLPIGGKGRNERSDDDLVAALERLQRENHFGTRRVATAVSGEAVIVRVLRLPVLAGANAQEMRFAIQSEAQDFIPFDMDDVIFDHQVLGTRSGDAEETTEVLIVAVRKDVIERLVTTLDRAGLQAAIIDVSSFALCNALAYGELVGDNEVVALVSIGASTTSVAILRGGMARFTRDLTTAGNTITNAIANELRISFSDAEVLKARYGIVMDETFEGSAFSDPSQPSREHSPYEPSLSHDPLDGLYEVPDETQPPDLAANSGIGSVDAISIYGDATEPGASAAPTSATHSGNPEDSREQAVVSEICTHYLGEISSELKRSFIFYENQVDGEPVDRIIICGGTAQLPNAAAYLTGLLDTPVQCMPSCPRIDWGNAGDTEETRSLLGVSVGLALRGELE